MTWLRNLWNRAIEPSQHITSREEREQASLHAAAIVLVMVAVILMTLVALIFRFIPLRYLPVMLSSLTFYGAMYALSRSRYYKWSARLFLWIAISFIYYSAIYLTTENGVFVLNFLVIPIMISGYVLPQREAAVNILLVGTLIVALNAINPQFSDNPFSVVILIAMVGSISIIASVLITRYRQQAVDNENRFHSLMQANYEGIMVIDGQDAKILDVNPAAEKTLGYPAEELIGRYPVEFIVPEDRHIARNVWEQKAENIPVELRIMTGQGYELNVEARLRPYRFQSDPGYVLTILDITDRKQAENFIIESEERFRAIFNESIHYTGVLDSSGKILELNERAYDKFGFLPQDVIGKYLYDFDVWAHTEKSKARIKQVIDRAINGEASRYESQARDKDGNVVYMDFSLKPIIDMQGLTQMMVAESRDITDFRHAESQRREFEQRYETLFNKTNDAVIIFDMDGGIIDANQRAESMFATNRDGIIGHSIYEFVVDDEIEESSSIMLGLLAGERVSLVSERQMKRATGEYFYAETLGLVVTDEDDKPRYVQSMVRDISARKREEQERFAHALDTERTQLLTHFIENASHHFRTPITNMKTRMYLLPRVFDKPDKREEQIAILNHELERLQNILNDLLMVLRLQKDDTEYKPVRVHVNQLISEVRQNFEGRAMYTDFDWTWQLNGQNPVIFCDKGLFARAMINIIENSCEHTPSGKKISLRSFSQASYLVIDIIDEGRGIPENELPHIFDDFFRGQIAMQEDSTGSGLGLSISRIIVERYHGKIFAASPDEAGTHIQIILPYYGENGAVTEEVHLPDSIILANPQPSPVE